LVSFQLGVSLFLSFNEKKEKASGKRKKNPFQHAGDLSPNLSGPNEPFFFLTKKEKVFHPQKKEMSRLRRDCKKGSLTTLLCLSTASPCGGNWGSMKRNRDSA